MAKIHKFISVSFLTLLFVCAVCNAKIIIHVIDKNEKEKGTITEIISEIQNGYISEVSGKNFFVDLNGAYSRLIGKRVCNEVVRLNNGMLTQEVTSRENTKENAYELKRLSEYLNDRSIPFFFVQAPDKMDNAKALLPTGLEYYADENVNEFLTELDKYCVNYIDLRKEICKDNNSIEKYYYKTDHHWNPQGAFLAFTRIVNYIHEIYPNENIDESILDINNWEIHTVEHGFLGSRGTRTGKFFGGIDDLMWIVPGFSTEISCSMPYQEKFYKGSFENANIREIYIDECRELGQDAYYLYVGGNYELVQHRNASASSGLKVLLVKDSYAIPTQTFLSTVFKEVDVIDLRHYDISGLAEYIKESKPQIVVMMYYTQYITDPEMFQFGLDKTDYIQAEQTVVTAEEQIKIEGSESKYRNYVIEDNLDLSTRYILTFDSAHYSDNNEEALTLALFDRGNNKILQTQILDVAYCNQEGFYWEFLTPDISDGNIDLLLYTGIRGKTENKTLKIHNMCLIKTTE